MESILIPAAIVVAAIVFLIIFLCSIYKVAEVDKALIITGGKEPKIKVSGGSFVIPIFRKAQFFDLCMLTVPASGDEIKTLTKVPIVVDWTAQIRPYNKDVEVLKNAIISFKERNKDEIENDIRLTIMGAVRGVVAQLTPAQVQGDMEAFKEAIIKSASDELKDMGFELVSLNIQDITDKNGYYDNIATIDKEEKRKEAEMVKAAADQQIREQTALSEKIAKQSELASELEIAEREKDNALKKAAFKIETDKAEANAQIAGELQLTVREQEVTEQKGRVEVIKQEQANLAAQKEKEVIATKAESDKLKRAIEAQAQADVAKIEADANVLVAERKAEAIKKEAIGNAEKVREEGKAQADVTREKGLAEVEIIKEKGLAEAEAEKAKLIAQAEGQKALAEALSSHDKVNFDLEKVKIEAEARISIATKTAEIMAELGKNAEFVHIGNGNNSEGKSDNVLLNTLAGVPALMKTLNVENEALNDKPFNDEVKGLVESLFGPVKGLLSSTTNTTINNHPETVSEPDIDNSEPLSEE